MFRAVAQLVHALATIQRAANLLVRLDKTLQLRSEVPILRDQHVAVVLEGINFSGQVGIALLQRLVGEAEVVLLASSAVKTVVGGAALALQIV